MNDRDARISAAGMVQAVIASGAPANEWRGRAAYGLTLTQYLADRLKGGEKKNPPPVPANFSPKPRRNK